MLTFIFSNSNIENRKSTGACSKTVLHRIRIAEVRVRFPASPHLKSVSVEKASLCHFESPSWG
jgi:hypothetical protein